MQLLFILNLENLFKYLQAILLKDIKSWFFNFDYQCVAICLTFILKMIIDNWQISWKTIQLQVQLRCTL